MGASTNDKLHIAFRCDASWQIGRGHVMRCLTLANALRERGTRCTFITRDEGGNLVTRIEEQGHSIEVLKAKHERKLSLEQEFRSSRSVIERIKPDLVVVDHYEFDHVWYERTCGDLPAMVIDDLANRRHTCSILLDQNFGRIANDYIGLVPNDARKLIGPKYALLRPEFKKARAKNIGRQKSRCGPLRVLISMGGADSEDSTGQILDTLSRSDFSNNIAVTVVMGANAPFLESVREKVRGLPYPAKVFSDVKDMASLIEGIDIAIGAAGGSVWERSCLGVPSMLLNIADNQRRAAQALDNAGAAIALGDLEATGWRDRLLTAFEHYSKPGKLLKLSEAASELVDGHGAARVASEIIAHFLVVREVKTSDARDIWEWRNYGSTARFYLTGEAIPYDEHLRWLASAIQVPGRYLLMVEKCGVSAAHIRFDSDNKNVGEATVSISIAPDFRGKNLSQAILIAGMKFAAEKGFTKLNATVHSENIASYRLFLSSGFCEVGTEGMFIFLSMRIGQNDTAINGANSA